MKLVGSYSGIGVALFSDLEVFMGKEDIKDIPFIPSPYCNPDIKEHRRVEVVKELQDNPDYRAVGVCKHKGCGGRKYYKQENLLGFVDTGAILPQSKIRRY